MNPIGTLPIQNPIYANPYLWESTIVSIAPFDTGTVTMECQPGFKDYRCKAAPRDGWTTLQIGPRIIMLRDLTQVDETNPTPGMRPVQQDAIQVATSLVSKWADNTIGTSGRLGVGLLPMDTTLPEEGEKPTGKFLEFLNGLKAQQDELATSAVKQASDWAQTGKSTYITNFYRGLAKWKYGNNAQKIGWVNDPGYAELKRCFCAKDIPLDATICPECRTDLVMKYIERGTMPKDDPIVLAEIQNALRARGAGNPIGVEIPLTRSTAPDSVEPEPIIYVEPSAEESAASLAIREKLMAAEKKTKQ